LLDTEVEELDDAGFVGKFDGVGNLGLRGERGVLLLLQDLTVMLVKSVTKTNELFSALELDAESKELISDLVVNFKGPPVVSECVQNDLADFSVEVDLGENLVLFLDHIHFATCK
jgi:hypothetical protein